MQLGNLCGIVKQSMEKPMQYNDPRQGPERPSTKDTKKLLLDINQRLRAKDMPRPSEAPEDQP